MSRRGLLIALIASLAVNLFVLGGLAGAALMGWPHPKSPPTAGPPRLAAVGAALSPQQRADWEAILRESAQTSGPKMLEARQLRRDSWRGLTADKPDTQAVLAGLDRSRAIELQARAEMDRRVVGFAATLPADERRKLAEALSRLRRGGPPPPGGWSRPGPAHGDGPSPDDR
jgi:uncharacterized membrane protein